MSRLCNKPIFEAIQNVYPTTCKLLSDMSWLYNIKCA